MGERYLGDYKILKQIGSGPLGNVLIAEHRFIKKHFALKILPSEIANDKDFVERFEREVAKIALLEHPHIVKVHNVSCVEGTYFLVTDCILDPAGEATNLAQYVSEHKNQFEEEEICNLLRQIADALDYAHTKGNTHLCLKLNNILIRRGNLGLQAYISDFGLSNVITPGRILLKCFQVLAEKLSLEPVLQAQCTYFSKSPEEEKLASLSQPFLQTYAFLAPEQKKSEQAGAAADAYAFGILAYFLIAGQFPEGFFLCLLK